MPARGVARTRQPNGATRVAGRGIRVLIAGGGFTGPPVARSSARPARLRSPDDADRRRSRRAHRRRRRVVAELRRRGHDTVVHGALSDAERDDWAWASEAAARDVVAGRADQAVVCCWTGTGASIAANKVAGARAALCHDAATAGGARRWNDANVLALSLRATSQAELTEILDAWFAGEPSADDDDRANVAHLAAIEDAARRPRLTRVSGSPRTARRQPCPPRRRRPRPARPGPSARSRSRWPSTSLSVRKACVTATLPHSSVAIS